MRLALPRRPGPKRDLVDHKLQVLGQDDLFLGGAQRGVAVQQAADDACRGLTGRRCIAARYLSCCSTPDRMWHSAQASMGGRLHPLNVGVAQYARQPASC